MRLYFVFICCLLCLAEISTAQDFAYIKRSIVKAVNSEEITVSLHKELTSLNSNDPLIWAYVGTLEGLKAKHSWNPYSKLKHVNRADKQITKAVTAAPDDLEIRFMRFSFQFYTPSFLGFSDDLAEDRKAIVRLFELRKFGRSDQDLVRSIAKFMLETKLCTPTEEQVLKKFI